MPSERFPFLYNFCAPPKTTALLKLTQFSKELHSQSSIDEKKEHEEQPKVPHLKPKHRMST